VKKTALYDNHVRRNGRMVDFAGWEMPLQYDRVMEEHRAVRQAAGLFDVSHMGLVTVSTGDIEMTRAFLNYLVPQDLNKLYPGKAVYTQFLNEQGGIIDDIIVYMLPESHPLSDFHEFLVICNAANTDKDIAWMRKHSQVRGINAEITLWTGEYSLFALQGPRFADVLARTGFDTERLPKRFFVIGDSIQGIPVLMTRTGYTGEDGVEILVRSTDANRLWDLLLELGAPVNLKPIGLAARDTLRLEAAYPLHGHDISENDTPLEAGLGWSVKLKQEADFIGKQALLAQQADGVPKEFYCFTLDQKMIARQHDEIWKNDEKIGEVTSGSISPLYNVPIGMGYIRRGAITGPGEIVQIKIRNKTVDAEIVERPFYQK